MWTLTPEETKASREQLVPLTDLALAIIAEQPVPADGANGGYLFTTTGKSPLSGWSKAKRTLDKAVADICREEEIKPPAPWRFHDLRRTVATHMEDALGIPPHIVGSVLNHAPAGYKGVTAVYTRGNLIFGRRRALVAWSRLLRLIVEGGALWETVAVILRPETEADAARTDEFRRMAQADEATWTAYILRLRTAAIVEEAA